jgi:hypothetical protein
MKILRALMILVMVVIKKVFKNLETEGILGIELRANLAKGEISVVLGDIMI